MKYAKCAARTYADLYSFAQWAWARDRYLEGYSALSICKFLDVSFDTFKRRMQLMDEPLRRAGERRLLGPDRFRLPPLETRKDEFNALIALPD